MEVVEVCRNGRVNEIYVSSLICRPAYQERINIINRLLSQNSEKLKYYFIDNSITKTYHLWKDNLHLKNNGVNMLAYNFIDVVNSMYI